MQYGQFLESKFKAVATALALLAAVTGALSKFFSDTVYFWVALTLIVAAALLFTNLWLAQRSRPTAADVTHRPMRRSWVVAVHVSSIVIAALMLAGAVAAMRPQTSGVLLARAGLCKFAIPQLSELHSTGGGDVSTRLALQGCYEQEGDYYRSVQELETILGNRDLLAQVQTTSQPIWRLRFELGSQLLGEEYQIQYEAVNSTLPPDVYPRAVHELTLSLSGENWMGTHWMLGFAKAASGADADSVEQHFAEADRLLALLEDDALRSRAFVQQKYWLGRAYIELGDREAAKRELLSGLDIISSAEDETLVDQKDRFILRLAEAETGSADLEGVRSFLSQLSDPENVPAALLRIATQQFWLAQQSQGQDDFLDNVGIAEEYAKLSLRALDEDFRPHMLLGALYFMSDRSDRAEAHFREWLRLKPGHPLALRFLTRTLLNMQRYENAMPVAQEWAERAPDDPDAHEKYGIVLAEAGRLDEAADSLRRSVSLDPGSENRVSLLALVLLEQMDNSLDPEDAEWTSVGEEILEVINPVLSGSSDAATTSAMNELRMLRAETYNRLAYHYAHRGENLFLAQEYAKRALRDLPDDPHLIDTLAWVEIRNLETGGEVPPLTPDDEYTRLKGVLTEVLDVLREDDAAAAEVLFHLGYLGGLHGGTDAARALYLQALDRRPDMWEVKAALADLDRVPLSGEQQ